jgi:hypothetical protein
VNAGRILREAGYDSEELRDILHPVDPDDINVWPASRWLRRLWRPGIKAVTQGRLIMVDPNILKGDRDGLARLVIHELVHVRQFAEQGYLRFMASYIGGYWRARLSGAEHRDSYLGLGAEQEARSVTQQMIELRKSR